MLENAKLTRDSLIVEVCSQIINNPTKVNHEDYQKAQEVIKQLASVPNPNNLYELGQLIGFLVDDKFTTTTNQYLDLIADKKNVPLGAKAEFKRQRGNGFALWQAKGSTAQRYMVGTEYVTLETDELSCAPAIELEQLENGQIDFTNTVNEAVEVMENKIIQQVETVIASYWDDLESPWYDSGNGVTTDIDPLIAGVARLGSPVILGDIAAIQQFVGLTGYNGGSIPDDIIVDFHRTGWIGNYRGAKLIQLVNPLINDIDMETTLLNPGYIYIIPAGADKNKRPLKIVYEGSVQTIETKHAQSRILEIAMYKKIGIGLVSNRFGMALYEDTNFTV
jgi:hypothetical protein